MGEDVATKEFEAGLSLLHMMRRPSDASSSAGSASPISENPSTASKKRQSGGATPRPAKKARNKALLTTGSLLLAAAQQVDPMEAVNNMDNEDDDDADDDGSEWSGDAEHDASRGGVRRNAQLHTLTRELNIEELREHFNKPIVDVAKEFGICTTFLKKICRRCGIKRWPHRQIRSLTRTLEMLRQAEANATSVQEKAKYAAQIAQVDAKMRLVMHDPDANGKLERVKKSVLSRSGSPGNRKISVDAHTKANSGGSSQQEAVAPDNLLHAVVAAAAAAGSAERTIQDVVPRLVVTVTSEAEAAAAEALLISASPRSLAISTTVSVPTVDLVVDALPAMTPTATSTPESRPPQGLKISPSHRKVLSVSKADNETRVRSSSLGSLQDLDCPEKLAGAGELPLVRASPTASVQAT